MTESKEISNLIGKSKNISNGNVNRSKILEKDQSSFKIIRDKKALLQKIILFNFLSFENDEVIFDSNFNIITGPNGAGKSSIFQALKFALGSNDYNGRYNKWSDFIRTGQNYTQVKVYIKANDGIYVFQRSVERDKTPKFMIKEPNNKKFIKLSRNRIHLIVKNFGIDPDNLFSFMSQGNIDIIKNFKEETLCDFVEKGIGLNKQKLQILNQKERITQLVKEYGTFKVQKNNLRNQYLELEPKIKKLEKKKHLEMKLKELQQEKIWIQRIEILKELIEIEEKYEIIKRTKLKIQKNEVESKTREKDLLKSLNILNISSEDINNSYIEEKLKHSLLSDKLNQMTSNKNALAEKITFISIKISELESNLKQLEIKLFDRTQNLKEINSKITEKSEDLKSLQDEQQGIIIKIQKNQSLILEYNSKLNSLNLNNERLNDLTDKQKDFEKELNSKINHISNLNQEIRKFKWFMNNPDMNLKEKMLDFSKMNIKNIKDLEIQIIEKEQHYLKLTEEIDQIKKNVYNKGIPKPDSIQNVINEIQERKINGFGPLIEYLEFDSLFQQAIESIFGYRVLNSFIARDQDSFFQIKEIVQNNSARCNIYLERNKSIEILPSISKAKNQGIFGYLANLIFPTSDELSIKKVIFSIANKTLVAKDHPTAMNFIKNYQYNNWIVTLDGEQIRPKKLVIEARPNVLKKKKPFFSNMNKTREYLNELIRKAEKNRDDVNSLKKKKKEIEDKSNIIIQRLSQIDSIYQKYKHIQILTTKKNSIIKKREEIYKIIIEKEQKISSLKIEVNEIKAQIPEQALNLQDKLEELPKLIQSNQKEINDYYDIKRDYEIDKKKNELAILGLKEDLSSKILEKEQLIMEIKEFDGEFYHLFQENLKSKSLLDELRSKKQAIVKKKENIIKETRKVENLLKNFSIELFKIEIDMKNIIQLIRDKKIYLEDFKINSSEYEKKYGKGRQINEIIHDIENIQRELKYFKDIDDSLLSKIKIIEDNINKINEKEINTKLEIDSAKDAGLRLESIYYEKFENSIKILENSMNEKFNLADLSFKVNLILKGDIKNVGLKIKVITELHSLIDSYQLSALSGGQRSMIGICLMLSLNQLSPSSLNIYDECDMFLDEKNAEIIAKLIQKLAHSGIQFILLVPTKNIALLQLANKVIGVSRNGKNGESLIHYSQPKITSKISD